MKCSIPGHESFDCVGICLNLECSLKTRLVCPKCLLNTHAIHSEKIILFGDILENKLYDIDYLANVTEIKESLENMKDILSKRESLQHISKNIEIHSSMIYDFLLSSFENINNNIKKEVENALNLGNDNTQCILKAFQEEYNLYNNTSLMMLNQLSAVEYETLISNTIIERLNNMKIKDNKPNQDKSNSKIKDAHLIESKLNDFYNSFKSDLHTLFKRYNEKIFSITTKSTVELVPNTYSKINLNLTLDQVFYNNTYIINKKQVCLIGTRPLLPYEKWKVKFDNIISLSCIGFGIASLDDPRINDILTSNTNSCLMCLCCNGPWSARGMKVLNLNIKLSVILKNSATKEITFEFNRSEDKYKIIDPNGEIHSEFVISQLHFQDNIIPIMNCSSGVSANFSILT
jgi:hypothetical protein